MKAKKLLFPVLSLSLSLLITFLVGCTKTPSVSSINSSSIPASSTVDNTPVELVWATWAISEEALKPTYMSMIETFMTDHKNVKITTISYPYAQYMSQLLVSVAGGNPPSFAHIKADWTRQFTDMKAQLNLNDILSKELKSDYYANVLSGATIDGNIVAAPWFNSPSAMFYNKTLLAKAGITTLPKTWNELIEDAYKVAALGKDAKGNKIYGIGIPNFKGEYGASLISLPFLWGNGGGITNSSGKIDLSAPGNIKAFEQIQKIYKDGVAPNGSNMMDTMNLFAQGVLGFCHNIQTASKTFISASPLGADFAKEYGVMTVPGQNAANGSGYLTEHYLMFFNKVDKKAYGTVNDLVDHFSGEKVLKILFDAGMGKMPDRSSAAKMSIFTTAADEITKVFVASLPTEKSIPVSDPHFIKVDEYYIDTLTKLATTAEPAETLCTKLSTQINDLYK